MLLRAVPEGAVGSRGKGGVSGWIRRRIPLPAFFLVALVLHKCFTDLISQFTRTTGTPYSATTVAILGEVIKVPLLLAAVAVFEGASRVGPVLRLAVSDEPLGMALPGLAYAAQNVLYFLALRCAWSSLLVGL